MPLHRESRSDRGRPVAKKRVRAGEGVETAKQTVEDTSIRLAAVPSGGSDRVSRQTYRCAGLTGFEARAMETDEPVVRSLALE